MAERVIRLEEIIEAPAAEVWKAWTTVEGLRAFLAPDAVIDVRPGGPWEIHFEPGAPAGSRGSEGCKVLEVKKGRRLVFEWNFVPGSPIRDLNVLRGMSLLELDCRRTAVRDLGPLRKMPLHYLYCDVTVATNGPNRGVIRSLEPTLKEINGRLPADFWKQPCDYTPPTGTPVIRRD